MKREADVGFRELLVARGEGGAAGGHVRGGRSVGPGSVCAVPAARVPSPGCCISEAEAASYVFFFVVVK